MLLTIILMTLLFAAVTAGVATVSLAIRDLRRRRPSTLDKRLGLDREVEDVHLLLAAKYEAPTSIDRAFVRLIDESGSRLDYTAATALIVGSGVVGLAAPLILLESLPLAAVGLVAGALVPLTFWSIRRWRRMRRMRKEVPETLQMVADAAHAGHTLEQTIRQVAREIRGELSTEFAYCARQLDLGHAPVAALSRMARRVPVPEFRIFATAALVHRRTGGNLALLTDRLAAAARDRQQLQGHLNAVTAGSRLSALGLVMGTLVAAGILAWIEPDYLGVFFTSQFGPMLLTTAIGLQLLGAIWVWRILQVRY